MNYLGVDIYAHNRGTRRFSGHSHDAIPVTTTERCPLCLGLVAVYENRIRAHLEHGGFTQCPVSGLSPANAKARAATMRSDYLLEQEGGFD